MELVLVYVAGFVVFWLLSGLKIITEYQEAVVLTLGKYSGIRKPGLRLVIPVFQRMFRVDLRLATVDVPRQEVRRRWRHRVLAALRADYEHHGGEREPH